METFTIRSNERVILAGKTGSGKTYLMRYLTKRIKRLVVLDGKGTLSDWGLTPFESGLDMLRDGEPVRLRALPGISETPAAYWDNVLNNAYLSGNVTVYIDELYAICPPNSQPPPALWACYTRGREFGVGVWSSTQRPVWIPLVALSESENYFMFRLTLEEDRRRMAAFMTPTVLTPIKDPHGFYYSRADWERPVYYKQLRSGGNL